MKTILLSTAILFSGFVSAQQQISLDKYDQQKSSGQLNGITNFSIVNPGQKFQSNSPIRYSGPIQTQSEGCECLIPLDSTFFVVPFMFGLPPEFRNDDASTNAIALPFVFNFYGVSYDTLFINNNGNISFTNRYGTFTSSSFPDTNYNMIAPFWSDVDTRDTASGLVYYKITPTALIVKWDNVGYYRIHANMLNTFQLIITNGQDSILPYGNNVSFCYGDMQWTTGDASNGVNGFGGNPSTTGFNIGNGVDYFQVTQNNQAGYLYNGPYGNPDGVDWLDNKEIDFNTGIIGNIPPIVLNSATCDTIYVFTGDTLRTTAQDSFMFDFYFMTPEVNQTVIATISSNAPPGAFTYWQTSNSSAYKSYSCIFRAKNIPPGIYTVTGTATDNGIPQGTTSSSIIIQTFFDPALSSINEISNNSQLSIFPNPADNQITIENIPTGKSVLTITNVLGEIIFSTPSSNSNAIIDTSEFSPGIYFINVVNENGERETIKFIRK